LFLCQKRSLVEDFAEKLEYLQIVRFYKSSNSRLSYWKSETSPILHATSFSTFHLHTFFCEVLGFDETYAPPSELGFDTIPVHYES
jgi:hypothetical protein